MFRAELLVNFLQTAKTGALKCKLSAGDMIIKKPEDPVHVRMYV